LVGSRGSGENIELPQWFGQQICPNKSFVKSASGTIRRDITVIAGASISLLAVYYSSAPAVLPRPEPERQRDKWPIGHCSTFPCRVRGDHPDFGLCRGDIGKRLGSSNGGDSTRPRTAWNSLTNPKNSVLAVD
jgi:hypothetical protein